MNEIIIYSKSNYGNINWYIKDAMMALHVSRLTGKKTVDQMNVTALVAMGFEVSAYHNGALIDGLDAMTGNVVMA